MGNLLEGCCGYLKLGSLDEMKMMSEVYVVSSGGFDVTDLVMVSTLVPTFADTYVPPTYYCLDFYVHHLFPHRPLPPPSIYSLVSALVCVWIRFCLPFHIKILLSIHLSLILFIIYEAYSSYI